MSDFLKEWQTLIGALIALAAALWTIRIMRNQTNAAEKRHQQQLARKAMAARAQMPDALSEICTYTGSVSGYVLVGNKQDLPVPPIAAVMTLKQVIEHIEDTAAQRTFELVSWYQIQQARVSDPLWWQTDMKRRNHTL